MCPKPKDKDVFFFIGKSYEEKTLREEAHDAQAENAAMRLRVSARVRFANSYANHKDVRL